MQKINLWRIPKSFDSLKKTIKFMIVGYQAPKWNKYHLKSIIKSVHTTVWSHMIALCEQQTEI